MYIFKKVITTLIMPFPLALEMLVVGACILWFSKRQKTGKTLVTLAAALFALFGSKAFSNQLLRPLEHQYPPLFVDAGQVHSDTTAIHGRWIVVMGLSYSHNTSLPTNGRVSGEFLARFVESVRLYRMYPNARILVSMAGRAEREDKEAFLRSLSTMLGIEPSDVVLMTGARDTKDEARLALDIIGTAPFFLVSSASHVPRSKAIFEGFGMTPIPAPTGYECRGTGRPSFRDFLPGTSGMDKSGRALHEYLGLLWARLRGQT